MKRHEQRLEIDHLADEMVSTELDVLLFVAKRLTMGRKQYGALNPLDGREWDIELAQELADAMVYISAGRQKDELLDLSGSQP